MMYGSRAEMSQLSSVNKQQHFGLLSARLGTDLHVAGVVSISTVHPEAAAESTARPSR